MFGRATITLGIDPHSSCFGAADWVTGRVNMNTCATYPSKVLFQRSWRKTTEGELANSRVVWKIFVKVEVVMF